MSEYTDNAKRLLKFIRARPFLFRDDQDDFTITDYLKWFEYRNKKEFATFPALISYEGTLIDYYKDQVYNSRFFPLSSGAMALHTIVQVSPECHLILVYANSEDGQKTLVFCTVYATSAADFFKFVDEAEPYAVEDERRVGFRDAGGIFNKTN